MNLSRLRHSLFFRLTTAFLLVALVGVAVVAILANRATTNGFNRFLMTGESATWTILQAQLGELYAQTGDWRPSPGRLCDWCDHHARCPAQGGVLPPLPEAAVPVAAALPAPGLDEDA